MDVVELGGVHGGVAVVDGGHELLAVLVALDVDGHLNVAGVEPAVAEVGGLVDGVLVVARLVVGELAEGRGGGAVDGDLAQLPAVLVEKLEGELLGDVAVLDPVDGLVDLDGRGRGGLGVGKADAVRVNLGHPVGSVVRDALDRERARVAGNLDLHVVEVAVIEHVVVGAGLLDDLVDVRARLREVRGEADEALTVVLRDGVESGAVAAAELELELAVVIGDVRAREGLRGLDVGGHAVIREGVLEDRGLGALGAVGVEVLHVGGELTGDGVLLHRDGGLVGGRVVLDLAVGADELLDLIVVNAGRVVGDGREGHVGDLAVLGGDVLGGRDRAAHLVALLVELIDAELELIGHGVAAGQGLGGLELGRGALGVDVVERGGVVAVAVLNVRGEGALGAVLGDGHGRDDVVRGGPAVGVVAGLVDDVVENVAVGNLGQALAAQGGVRKGVEAGGAIGLHLEAGLDGAVLDPVAVVVLLGVVQVEGELLTLGGHGAAVDGLLDLDGRVTLGLIGVGELGRGLRVGVAVLDRGGQGAVVVLGDDDGDINVGGRLPAVGVVAVLGHNIAIGAGLVEAELLEGLGAAVLNAGDAVDRLSVLLEGEIEGLALYGLGAADDGLVDLDGGLRASGIGVVDNEVILTRGPGGDGLLLVAVGHAGDGEFAILVGLNRDVDLLVGRVGPTLAELRGLVDGVLIRTGLVVGLGVERRGVVLGVDGGLGELAAVLVLQLEGELLVVADIVLAVDRLGHAELRGDGAGVGVVEGRGTLLVALVGNGGVQGAVVVVRDVDGNLLVGGLGPAVAEVGRLGNDVGVGSHLIKGVIKRLEALGGIAGLDGDGAERVARLVAVLVGREEAEGELLVRGQRAIVDGLLDENRRGARGLVGVVETGGALSGVAVLDLGGEAALAVVGHGHRGLDVGRGGPAVVVVAGLLHNIVISTGLGELNVVEAGDLAGLGLDGAKLVALGVAVLVGLVKVEDELLVGLRVGAAVDGLVDGDGGLAGGGVGVGEEGRGLFGVGVAVGDLGADGAVGGLDDLDRHVDVGGRGPAIGPVANLVNHVVKGLTRVVQAVGKRVEAGRAVSLDGDGLADLGALGDVALLVDRVALGLVERELEGLVLGRVGAADDLLVDEEVRVGGVFIGVVELRGFGAVGVGNGGDELLVGRVAGHLNGHVNVGSLGPELTIEGRGLGDDVAADADLVVVDGAEAGLAVGGLAAVDGDGLERVALLLAGLVDLVELELKLLVGVDRTFVDGLLDIERRGGGGISVVERGGVGAVAVLDGDAERAVAVVLSGHGGGHVGRGEPGVGVVTGLVDGVGPGALALDLELLEAGGLAGLGRHGVDDVLLSVEQLEAELLAGLRVGAAVDGLIDIDGGLALGGVGVGERGGVGPAAILDRGGQGAVGVLGDGDGRRGLGVGGPTLVVVAGLANGVGELLASVGGGVIHVRERDGIAGLGGDGGDDLVVGVDELEGELLALDRLGAADDGLAHLDVGGAVGGVGVVERGVGGLLARGVGDGDGQVALIVTGADGHRGGDVVGLGPVRSVQVGDLGDGVVIGLARVGVAEGDGSEGSLARGVGGHVLERRAAVGGRGGELEGLAVLGGGAVNGLLEAQLEGAGGLLVGVVERGGVGAVAVLNGDVERAVALIRGGHGDGHVVRGGPAVAAVADLVDRVGLGSDLGDGELIEAGGLAGLGGNGTELRARGALALVQVEGELLVGLRVGAAVDRLVDGDGGLAGGRVLISKERGGAVSGGAGVRDGGAEGAVAVVDDLDGGGHVTRERPTGAVLAGLVDGVRELLVGVGEAVVDRAEVDGLAVLSLNGAELLARGAVALVELELELLVGGGVGAALNRLVRGERGGAGGLVGVRDHAGVDAGGGLAVVDGGRELIGVVLIHHNGNHDVAAVRPTGAERRGLGDHVVVRALLLEAQRTERSGLVVLRGNGLDDVAVLDPVLADLLGGEEPERVLLARGLAHDRLVDLRGRRRGGALLVVGGDAHAGVLVGLVGDRADDRRVAELDRGVVRRLIVGLGLIGRGRRIEHHVGAVVGNVVAGRGLGLLDEVNLADLERSLGGAEGDDAVLVGGDGLDLGLLAVVLVNRVEGELGALKTLARVLLGNLGHRQAVAHGHDAGVGFLDNDLPADLGVLGGDAFEGAAVGDGHRRADRADGRALVGHGERRGVGHGEGEDGLLLAIDGGVLDRGGAAGRDVVAARIDDLERPVGEGEGGAHGVGEGEGVAVGEVEALLVHLNGELDARLVGGARRHGLVEDLVLDDGRAGAGGELGAAGLCGRGIGERHTLARGDVGGLDDGLIGHLDATDPVAVGGSDARRRDREGHDAVSLGHRGRLRVIGGVVVAGVADKVVLGGTIDVGHARGERVLDGDAGGAEVGDARAPLDVGIRHDLPAGDPGAGRAVGPRVVRVPRSGAVALPYGRHAVDGVLRLSGALIHVVHIHGRGVGELIARRRNGAGLAGCGLVGNDDVVGSHEAANGVAVQEHDGIGAILAIFVVLNVVVGAHRQGHIALLGLEHNVADDDRVEIFGIRVLLDHVFPRDGGHVGRARHVGEVDRGAPLGGRAVVALAHELLRHVGTRIGRGVGAVTLAGRILVVARGHIDGVLHRVGGRGVRHGRVVSDGKALLADAGRQGEGERRAARVDFAARNDIVGLVGNNVLGSGLEGVAVTEGVGEGVATHVSLEGTVVELDGPGDVVVGTGGGLAHHGVLNLGGVGLDLRGILGILCAPAPLGGVLNVVDFLVVLEVLERGFLDLRRIGDVVVALRAVAQRDGGHLTIDGHGRLLTRGVSVLVTHGEGILDEGQVVADGVGDDEVLRTGRGGRDLDDPGVGAVHGVVSAVVGGPLVAVDLLILCGDGDRGARAGEDDGRLLAVALGLVRDLELEAEVGGQLGDVLVQPLLGELDVDLVVLDLPGTGRLVAGVVERRGGTVDHLDVARDLVINVRLGERRELTGSEVDVELAVQRGVGRNGLAAVRLLAVRVVGDAHRERAGVLVDKDRIGVGIVLACGVGEGDALLGAVDLAVVRGGVGGDGGDGLDGVGLGRLLIVAGRALIGYFAVSRAVFIGR